MSTRQIEAARGAENLGLMGPMPKLERQHQVVDRKDPMCYDYQEHNAPAELSASGRGSVAGAIKDPELAASGRVDRS